MPLKKLQYKIIKTPKHQLHNNMNIIGNIHSGYLTGYLKSMKSLLTHLLFANIL